MHLLPWCLNLHLPISLWMMRQTTPHRIAVEFGLITSSFPAVRPTLTLILTSTLARSSPLEPTPADELTTEAEPAEETIWLPVGEASARNNLIKGYKSSSGLLVEVGSCIRSPMKPSVAGLYIKKSQGWYVRIGHRLPSVLW